MATSYTSPTKSSTTYTSPSKSDVVKKRGAFDSAVFDAANFDTTADTYDPLTYQSKNSTSYTNPNQS